MKLIYLELETVVSRLLVILLHIVVVVVPERGALVHEEVRPRRRLQLAGAEDALAAAETGEGVEIVLLLLLGILLLLLLSSLLWLEEELSPVALAQLQRLARRVIPVAGDGGGGGAIVGLLAPLVVARLPTGDGRDALARTLQMEEACKSSSSSRCTGILL